jgi:hypothetical protein
MADLDLLFSYPRVWVRHTSTNSDGHTILHPTIEGISIIGLGQHAHVLGWDSKSLRV